MAKGQTDAELNAWVPTGLKVRTAASTSPPQPVAPEAAILLAPTSDLAAALQSTTPPIPVPTEQGRRSTDQPQNQGAVKRRGFRPMPILSILSLISLCVLLALGQWQWDKFVLKSKAPEAIIAIEPSFVSAALEAPDPEYRPVIVDGLIDPRTIRISVVQDGVRGYRLFSPVIMEAGGIFVDRGFVSEEAALDAVPPTGQVRLTGVLRTGAKANRYTPDNDPAADVWYWPDLTAMADTLLIQTSSARYYVAQSEVDPLSKGQPTANPYADSKGTSQTKPETHLGYALQWWGFGLALIGVYIGLHVRAGRLVFKSATS